MFEKNKGAKTLLWSIVMSAPGPLVVGLGLIAGRSSTQIADFVRRSTDLLAIIVSFIVYTTNQRNGIRNDEQKQRLERDSNIFVGIMMCLAGLIMAIITLAFPSNNKGNVIPGLLIAIIAVITNSAFWIKYTHLNKVQPNAILAVQARFYRAKALVDTSITLALASVLIAPKSPVSYWLDIIGSLIVAFYLIFCGVRTIYEAKNLKENATENRDELNANINDTSN